MLGHFKGIHKLMFFILVPFEPALKSLIWLIEIIHHQLLELLLMIKLALMILGELFNSLLVS